MVSGNDRGQSAYISFDVDRIKEFVFAGQRPLDITGASELVKQLDTTETNSASGKLEAWLEAFRPFKVIYAVGGSGLIRLIDGSRANELCCHLEQQFRETTRTGSCSAVPVLIPKTPPTGEAFRDALRLLGIRLQQRKAEKAGQEPAEAWTMGNLSRCAACGIYPSQFEDKELPSEPEWLCGSCFQKRKTGRELRKREHRPAELAISLNHISDTYIACLYADVNKAGKLLLACNEEYEVRRFSCHLFDTVQSVQKRIKGRFQSPVIGGDDLLVLLPAHHCVQVTLDLWKTIEDELTRVPLELQNTEIGKKLEGVSLSIGLAVVEYQLPINFIFEMAQSLLKSAKATSYERKESAIDYMLLKGGSPMSENIPALRRRHFMEALPNDTLFPSSKGAEMIEIRRTHLTRRPYTRPRLNELARLMLKPEFADWKSPLRSVLGLFQTASPMEVYVHTQYQKSRHYLPDHLDDLLHQLEIEKEGTVLTTGIGDLLELAEMNSL